MKWKTKTKNHKKLKKKKIPGLYQVIPLIQLFFGVHGDDPEEGEGNVIDGVVVVAADVKNAVSWNVQTVLQDLKTLH